MIISVNRKDMAGYFINQAIQYVTINADKIRFETIINKLRTAAIAAGQNTMTYQEVVGAINDMKSLSEKLQLTCSLIWFMITNISTKMRSSNQPMKEFMMNLKHLGVTEYLVLPKEAEQTTATLIQGEKQLEWDKLQANKEKIFANHQQLKDRQRSIFMLVSQDKTNHVFEINLNGNLRF